MLYNLYKHVEVVLHNDDGSKILDFLVFVEILMCDMLLRCIFQHLYVVYAVAGLSGRIVDVVRGAGRGVVCVLVLPV